MFSACKKSYWTDYSQEGLLGITEGAKKDVQKMWEAVICHRSFAEISVEVSQNGGIIQKWWVGMAPNGGGNFRWDLLNSLMFKCSTKKTWVRENFKSVTQLVDAVQPGARQWRANGPSFERSKWKIAEFYRPFLRCLATTWEGEKVSLRLGVVKSYLWNRQDRHSRKSHQGTTALISSDILASPMFSTFLRSPRRCFWPRPFLKLFALKDEKK
jgi:hypothetical protein